MSTLFPQRVLIFFNPNQTNMRFFTSLLLLSLVFICDTSAEGTRELAPNASIMIGANTTTDIAALHINHPAYNNFASYTNNDPHSRLYIHIKDPSTECIYLGFSSGHFNENTSNPTRKNFEYRIKDPAGNVVFGPVTILSTGGNIQNWSEGFTGPMQLNGPGGYNAHHVTALDLSSQGWSGAGDYYVEFLAADGMDVLVDFWDITVADCMPETPVGKKGRVWSYNWSFFAINDFNFPNRPFNGAFFVCSPDPDDADRAFITKIDFNGSGFRPAAFNLAFNSFGSNNTGNIEEDRKSDENNNSTQSEYAIFLNDPVELCETAIVGEITLHGIGRCNAEDYCIKFTASKAGQVELLLDLDGPDDIYTPGTRDVLITYEVEASQVNTAVCVQWDGLDGLGNPLPEIPGTTIPVTLSYAQGIYHFPIYDAEFMTTGFRLEAVRPAGSIPLLYYDDSDITLPSGSGEPAVQLAGCNVPCHQWTNFPNANTPGFGNLNTINSWWFSQRIVRQDVLLIPGYFTCSVSGPQSICQGGDTDVLLETQLHPDSITSPDIVSVTWEGPGITGTNVGNVINIDAEGTYQALVVWVTELGDTCSTSCDYQLVMDPPLAETIDTLIVQGQVLVINNEQYTEAGQYFQNLVTTLGCDSILTINVKVIQSVLHYNLDACQSFTTDASPMDYTEFTPLYPDPLSCADITASIVFREPAQMQKHSCTPGVNNSVAMCVSSLDTCSYDPGNDASLIFEMTVTPDPDTAVHVTGFSFYEKAPETYNWILGPSGPNNYPTFYGFRVLKNGVEIYRREDIATTTDWTLQTFNFLDEEEFIIEDPATFRFELLPYCLVGNGATVAAWDVDDFKVEASCAPFEGLNQIISGIVRTQYGVPVSNVRIDLTESLIETSTRTTATNLAGQYGFEEIPEGSECQLNAYQHTAYLNGVSTMDLIIIQKHLLGIRPFDSPYQYVAADANRSNHVSAKDLLELRKLILGYYPALPNNTSWRVGNADEHLNGSYPWGFKEPIDIEQLQYDLENADFTAVKIGDLNGDAQVNFNDPEIISRNSDGVTINYQDQKIFKGVPVTVDFTLNGLSKLSGMQLALTIDKAQVTGFSEGKLTITEDHINITDEVVRISWDHMTPVAINPAENIFTLTLIPERNGRLSQIFTLSDLIRAEAYSEDVIEIKEIALLAGSEETSVSGNILFQNEPNPFDQNTTIRFELNKGGVTAISISDMSGRTLKNINREFSKGMHTIEFAADEFGNQKGVFICRLESEGWHEVIRMVRM